MKKGLAIITGLYLLSSSCQSNKSMTDLILDPFKDEETSFAQMYIVDEKNNDTTYLQTDNWGRAKCELDTTKTYFAFVKPGYEPTGEPGDQFKPYKTQSFSPKGEKLNILKKESELEILANK